MRLSAALPCALFWWALAGTTAFADGPTIAGGIGHTCTLTSEGTALCWGLNDAGQLATASGHLVLGTSGPISGLSGTVRIEKDGRIFNNEVEVGALQLYDFNEPEKLQRHGHLLFESGPQQAAKEIDGELVPGALEGSNVNAVMAMVELVRVQRSFESAKKAIDTYRDMDRRLQHNVAD